MQHDLVEGGHTAVVLIVPPHLSSAGRLAYFEPIDGAPAIIYLKRQLSAALAETSPAFGILTRGMPPSAELLALADRECMAVIHRPDASFADNLREAAVRLNAGAIMIYRADCIFPDLDLSDDMLAYLRSESLDGIFPQGFPEGLLPQIFSRAALERLARLNLPQSVGTDPRKLMEGLSQLPTDGSVDKPVFRCGHVFCEEMAPEESASLPDRALLEDPLSIRAARCVARILRYRTVLGGQAAALMKSIGLRFEARARRNAAIAVRRAAAGPGSGRRILFCTLAKGYSGAEESLRILISNCSRFGYDPVALLPGQGVLFDRLTAAGIPTIALDHDGLRLTPYALAYWQRILEILQPGLLHIDSFPAPAGYMAAAARGLPVIQHVRAFLGTGASEFFRFARYVATVSEAVRLDLMRGALHPDRVVAVHNGIDVSAWPDHRLVRAYSDTEGHDFVLAMVSRIDPAKRQDLLIEALAQLASRGLHPKARFVGESHGGGNYYQRILTQAQELGVAGQISFTGFESQMQNTYRAADALVLCSDREPFPRCVLEALAMGLPVVASRGGGVPEMLENGHSSLLFEPNDAAGLAAGIAQLMCSPGLRRTLSVNGRAHAAKFSVEAHVRTMCGLFEKAIESASESGVIHPRCEYRDRETTLACSARLP